MSWLANYIGKKLGEKVADRISPNDRRSQTELLDSGKTFTITAPTSSRFTFNEKLSPDSKAVKNFTPTTDKQKETLSPEGYFRQGDINRIRQTLIDRAIKKRQEQLKAEGKEMSPERAAEIKQRAEDSRLYEAQVPSTAIRKIKYNPKTKELFVTFNGNSKTYWYPKVPEEEVRHLMEAQSKGEYFLRNIHDQYTANPGHKRNGAFNYRKARKLYKKGA